VSSLLLLLEKESEKKEEKRRSRGDASFPFVCVVLLLLAHQDSMA
jgi:hypothetical protein